MVRLPMLKLASSCALLLVAVALVNIALTGCGEAKGDSDSQAYREVLQGLSDAAQSGADYDAVRHARDLKPADQAAIEGFCQSIREFALSDEDPRDFPSTYVSGRVEEGGRMRLREMKQETKLNVDPSLVGDAMGELREAIDLGSLSIELNRNYVGACYH